MTQRSRACAPIRCGIAERFAPVHDALRRRRNGADLSRGKIARRAVARAAEDRRRANGAVRRESGGVDRLAIVPIGLTFERKEAPRSRVLVQVGEPIVMAAWRAPDRSPRRRGAHRRNRDATSRRHAELRQQPTTRRAPCDSRR